MGDNSKQVGIKNLILKHNPDLVLIQETKRVNFDPIFMKSIWSSKNVGWIFVESFGRSGGMLILWDECKISMLEYLKGGYTLSIKLQKLDLEKAFDKVDWDSFFRRNTKIKRVLLQMDRLDMAAFETQSTHLRKW